MKHTDVRFNSGTQEWFCAKCGQTSDHGLESDARAELEQFDCRLPSVDRSGSHHKDEGLAILRSTRNYLYEYKVSYRYERTWMKTVTLEIVSTEGRTIPDGGYLLDASSEALIVEKRGDKWMLTYAS